MRDFFGFLLAVLNNWAGYATGGMIVATIALYFMWKDRPMGRTIGLGLSVLFLFMAFFKAWKDQKSLVDNAQKEVQKVIGQLTDLTVSRISGTVDFAILGAQPENGSHAALIVSLTNTGAGSAIEPGSWKLLAITRDKSEHYGQPNTLLDKPLDFCLGAMRAMRFVRNDALYLKASIPIPRNGFTQGVLWFGISGLERPKLVDPATTLVLQAKSVAGQNIHISTTVQELMTKSNQSAFFAGIENPRPLEMLCKENAPY